MIAYGTGILPLIKIIKLEIPDVTQPWYADDARDLSTFARLETYFDLLTLQVPGWRYQPDPTKSVLIVHPENIKSGRVFGHVTDLGCAQVHVILGVT